MATCNVANSGKPILAFLKSYRKNYRIFLRSLECRSVSKGNIIPSTITLAVPETRTETRYNYESNKIRPVITGIVHAYSGTRPCIACNIRRYCTGRVLSVVLSYESHCGAKGVLSTCVRITP